MAQVDFDPFIKWFRGRIGKLVYRRAHNGKISVFSRPDMTRVKQSQAQKDHQRSFGEASRYASAAVADPDVRAVYVQMAIDQNKDPLRPSDVVSSDYFHNGTDLLWKKHMGDLQKPDNWNMENYAWYAKRTTRKPKKMSRRF